jgi:hypothetical protein
MASINDVLNPYLVLDGHRWEPVLPVFEDTTRAGALPESRRQWSGPRYEGILSAIFPSLALLNAFLAFWSANRTKTWTWTNPDDSASYSCKFFGGDRPTVDKVGPTSYRAQFGVVGV